MGKLMTIPDNTFVKISENKGLGIFAGCDFEEYDVIELCETIYTDDEDEVSVLRMMPTIKKYFFNLWEDKRSVAIALGNGSLYNHSSEPNVNFGTLKVGNGESFRIIIRFYAIKSIRSGDELLIDYTGGGKRKKLGFMGKGVRCG